MPGKPAPEKISLADFEFDETESRIERCPNQKSPVQQGDCEDNQEHWAVFSKEDCAGCPFFNDCPVKGKRTRRMGWNREKVAIAKRHREVKTPEFKEEYKMRSGIEATNSELKNKHGAANLKVRGYERIGLAMTFKCLAINIKRMILYAISTLKHTEPFDAQNAVSSVVCVLASLLLIVIGVARSSRSKFYLALKGLDLGYAPVPGFKNPGYITTPLRG